MAGGRVNVVGLKELRRDLKALDSEGGYKAELKDAGRKAAEVVATEARRSALGAANPRMGSVAAMSIRALAGQTRATVAGGKASVPWYAGHEFGSARYRQFPRPRQGGYHLFPALGRKRDEVIEVYSNEIGALLKRHGLD